MPGLKTTKDCPLVDVALVCDLLKYGILVDEDKCLWKARKDNKRKKYTATRNTGETLEAPTVELLEQRMMKHEKERQSKRNK